MFTSHGHYIMGTERHGYPGLIAMCGGPGLCAECSKEASEAMQTKLQEKGSHLMEIERYTRKSFPVDAVRVTNENMEQVAEWCKGTIVPAEEGGLDKHIKVEVLNVMNDRQTQAFVGDRVLYANKGFKVYTNKAFLKSFDPVKESPAEELRTVSTSV